MFFHTYSPDLTWRDVQHLIVETSISSLPGHTFYTNGAGKSGE